MLTATELQKWRDAYEARRRALVEKIILDVLKKYWLEQVPMLKGKRVTIKTLDEVKPYNPEDLKALEDLKTED